MKKMILLLTVFTAVALLPTIGFTKLILDLPPLYAANSCSEHAGCPEGPCYDGCNDPCVPCNLTCQNYAGCADGPCYPECTDDPCNPCASATATSLNDTGIITAVGGTGHEDADYGRDVTDDSAADGHEGFNFDNTIHAPCVLDNVTGLVWSLDKDISNWDGTSTIVSTANTDSLCGGTGWRLPTVKELVNIVSYDAVSYAAGKTIDTTYFTDTVGAFYWTSTVDAADADKQWAVKFTTGVASGNTSTDSLTEHRVRLVRTVAE